ncbi:MAG: hypothetical protein IJH68_10470 [Thermoguttaceae bacterium]|nr:hypothetical protein [Thermoguttaceae bacterium]MBR2584417.1 hypothetical protein [Thermoguttaceae bacterium]
MKHYFSKCNALVEYARKYFPNIGELSKDERRAETRALLEMIRELLAEGNQGDHSETIKHYKTLVIGLNVGLFAHAMEKAHLYISQGYEGVNEPDDYEQSAMKVMFECMEKFDPAKGEFSSYVVRSILNEVFHITITTPASSEQLEKNIREIKQAINNLKAAGKTPTIEAIYEQAHRTNPKSKLTVKKIKESLPFMDRDNSGEGGHDRWPGKPRGPEDKVLYEELKELILKRLRERFSSNEVEMICDKLFNGYEDDEIVDKYHVDPKAFKKLWARARKFMREDPDLRRFLPD